MPFCCISPLLGRPKAKDGSARFLVGGSLFTNLAESLGENQKRPLFPAY